MDKIKVLEEQVCRTSPSRKRPVSPQNESMRESKSFAGSGTKVQKQLFQPRQCPQATMMKGRAINDNGRGKLNKGFLKNSVNGSSSNDVSKNSRDRMKVSSSTRWPVIGMLDKTLQFYIWLQVSCSLHIIIIQVYYTSVLMKRERQVRLDWIFPCRTALFL